MRWSGQQVVEDGVGAAAALPGLQGLVRTVRVPEFAGAVFHEVEARSVLNRVPGSSPVPSRWTVNPYRGCSHACVYCLGGDTRVLMADGTSRPLAELAVGDAVLGTQEDGGGRRYVRTTVRAHWSTRKPAVRVRLADGTVLTASGEHRFLTERGWRHVTGGWCRSGRRPRLRAGDVLLGPGRAAVAPAAGPRPATPGYRRGYLCGVVRGDGAGPAEPDRCFPSVHLELEALGRAHHYLAGLPASAVRATATRDLPPAARPVEHRSVEHRSAVARSASRSTASAGAAPPSGPTPPGSATGGTTSAAPLAPGAGAPSADRVAAPPVTGAGGGAAGRSGPRTGPRRGCGAVVDGRIPPPWESAGEPAALPTPDEAAAWPAEAGEDWCAGFLAGVLDARGRVVDGVLRVRHADEEVVGRVAGALHRLGFRFVMEPPVRGERTVALAGGAGELLRLLRVTGPAVRREVAGAPVAAATAVTAVEESGREEDLYDITTGTGDFVAEGVVSHNCFARGTHTYLDLDAGADFDSQIVVKVNAPQVLERDLRSRRYTGEPVAMGTNTDPYQRVEGRYALMPGIVRALARAGAPFSILTKGTVLSRDLPLLAGAAADVPVGLGVSIALLDRELQARLEPGTPSPRARLDLVRRISAAGLPCEVVVAPVLPMLTDSPEALDALLGRIAGAGATGATVMGLHLRPGAREWFLAWLAREHPRLVEPYGRLYRRGAYLDPEYRRALAERVAPLLRRHGLTGPVRELHGCRDAVTGASSGASTGPRTRSTVAGAPPATAPARGAGGGDQLSLL